MVDKESPLTQRSYHVVTKFGNYFFRVRNPYMLVTFLAAISALLVQVFNLPRLILMVSGWRSHLAGLRNS